MWKAAADTSPLSPTFAATRRFTRASMNLAPRMTIDFITPLPLFLDVMLLLIGCIYLALYSFSSKGHHWQCTIMMIEALTILIPSLHQKIYFLVWAASIS